MTSKLAEGLAAGLRIPMHINRRRSGKTPALPYLGLQRHRRVTGNGYSDNAYPGGGCDVTCLSALPRRPAKVIETLINKPPVDVGAIEIERARRSDDAACTRDHRSPFNLGEELVSEAPVRGLPASRPASRGNFNDVLIAILNLAGRLAADRILRFDDLFTFRHLRHLDDGR